MQHIILNNANFHVFHCKPIEPVIFIPAIMGINFNHLAVLPQFLPLLFVKAPTRLLKMQES